MLKISYSGQYKKDYKRCQKRGYNMDLLKEVVAILAIPDKLPEKNRDHYLTGNYKDRKECHIAPDWFMKFVKMNYILIEQGRTRISLNKGFYDRTNSKNYRIP